MEAATARQGLRVFCSAAALWGVVMGGCTANVTVEVKPSDCINPPTGDCHGSNESRILEVRLYQLKQPVNACQLDVEAFAQGKDLEALAGALVESQRSDDVRLSFKVAPGEPRSVGTWKILRNASHVLAVAIGRGRSKNSIRLIPVDRVKNGWHLPKLYFEGYDICPEQSVQGEHDGGVPMSLFSKVAWKDGMFLLPQHFQQAERSLETTLRQQQLGPHPLAFGVLDLALNEAAIGEGRVEVVRCQALWPDATPVSIPAIDKPPPALTLPNTVTARIAEVYLTIPARRAQVALVATTAERKDARFVEQTLDVADDHNPDQVQTIEVAVKNVRLGLGSDGLEGLVTLKIAELERTADGAWSLRRDYVPPCPFVGAAPQLIAKVQELVSRANARAEELTAQRRLRGDALEFNAADLLNFYLLHTLNSHLPKLRHQLAVPGTHPEQLYAELLGLFGGLLAFSPTAAREMVPYQHGAISECFATLLGRLYDLLGFIVRARYTVIPLKQTRNAWDGRVEDGQLLEAAHFYLVATGELPRAEFDRLPSACKVADSSRVESLARTANPGLTLVPVSRPPPPVPVRQDAVYFQVRAQGPLWQEIRRSGQIGVFVPRAPEGLHLELVALHDAQGAAA